MMVQYSNGTPLKYAQNQAGLKKNHDVHHRSEASAFRSKHSPEEMYVCFQVSTIRLVGMMLVVFVNKLHKNHIKDVAMEHVGTGIMGKMVRTCPTKRKCLYHQIITSLCWCFI